MARVLRSSSVHCQSQFGSVGNSARASYTPTLLCTNTPMPSMHQHTNAFYAPTHQCILYTDTPMHAIHTHQCLLHTNTLMHSTHRHTNASYTSTHQCLLHTNTNASYTPTHQCLLHTDTLMLPLYTPTHQCLLHTNTPMPSTHFLHTNAFYTPPPMLSTHQHTNAFYTATHQCRLYTNASYTVASPSSIAIASSRVRTSSPSVDRSSAARNIGLSCRGLARTSPAYQGDVPASTTRHCQSIP